MCCIMNEDQNLLEVEDLRVHFPVRWSFSKSHGILQSVMVSVFQSQKENFGLVGESGCVNQPGEGYCSIAKPTAGKIRFKRREISEIEDRGLF